MSRHSSPGRRPSILLILILLLLLPGTASAAGPVRRVVGQDVQHAVQPGELLPDIARRYGVALEHLSWANGIPITKAAPEGRTLRIPLRRVLPANPPRDGLVLNVPERAIFLFRNGQFQEFYPVAVGRPTFKTPRGSFQILNKSKDPTWFPPDWANLDREFIPPGPENPLGDRWMGVTAGGVGIHGTVSPYSIGMAASHGCIRMYPDSARELYDRVWVGMPVRIEYETAKLGKDPATGEFYLATFPDIYNLGDPQRVAERLLRHAGLAGRVSPEGLSELVALRDVRPLEDPGPAVAFRVNGEELRPAPTMALVGDEVYVAPAALRALGLESGWDEGLRAVVVWSGGRRVVVPLNGSASSISQVSLEGDPLLEGRLRGGKGLVPARAVFDHFGVQYEWDPSSAVLDVQVPSASEGGTSEPSEL